MRKSPNPIFVKIPPDLRSSPSFLALRQDCFASDMKRSEGRLFDRPLIIAGHICSAEKESEAKAAREGSQGRGAFCHPTMAK